MHNTQSNMIDRPTDYLVTDNVSHRSCIAVLTCHCGAITADEMQDALADGWRLLDLNNERVFRGMCPECR